MKLAVVMGPQMNSCPRGTLRLKMSQKKVIEAKRKELERFKRMNVYRVVTRESMERDEEEKMISIKWVITSKGTEEHPIAKARLVAREFRTMLADVKTAFLKGDARRLLCVDMHLKTPWQHLVDTSASLNVPCMELKTPR